MTGGQALVRSLYREGVRVVFGLPGVQLYHAMDALYEEPGIRFITTRHEQGAAYMAFGYAQAGGGVGTALVVPGPGLLNASAGIGTAYAASSPVLLVAGQIARDLIGVNRGELHDVHDQLDAIRTVTKWAVRVLYPADIPSAVQEAFRHLNTGRPRPVEIEIPPDTLEEVAEVQLMEQGVYERPAASAQSIEEGARILVESERPIILAGGGVISSGASEALQRVAEHLQAPVFTTSEGKGAISDRHQMSMGAAMRGVDASVDRPLDESNVILAVGTRLASAKLRDEQRIVQIDVDREEIGRNRSNTFGLVGDARLSLEELYRVLSSSAPPRPSRRAELEAIKSARFGSAARLEPQHSLLRAIRAAMPDDGILVAGMTQVGYYSRIWYPVYAPRSYVNSSYFGNLGFAYPTALGAKVAQPDKAVVAVSGDGGFLYNSQELATAVQYGINAVVIVFNDNAYGNVLRAQMTKFGGRIIGAELHNPDFVRLAEAYGARGVRASGADQLEAALREALALDAPTLIEVPVGMMPSPWG
jgi:acetolactate synthase-1/2/3 large subunit